MYCQAESCFRIFIPNNRQYLLIFFLTIPCFILPSEILGASWRGSLQIIWQAILISNWQLQTGTEE